MSARAAPGAPAGSRACSRWLPLLLVPVALLPDLAAALPLRTYFFRDFTVTFLPLRLFAARELREGRFPFWNPYVFEGTFQLPALYPPDLLTALWPSPAFVSWLLTLHLPLAALAAYWLARELGASRAAAFLAGAAYALGRVRPVLPEPVRVPAGARPRAVRRGALRRAARLGGRLVIVAALALALALSTLAVEFVAQAVVLGVALGLVARRGSASLRRLALALALGRGSPRCPSPSPSASCPRRRGARDSPPRWRSATPSTRPCSCSPCCRTCSACPPLLPRRGGAAASSARGCRTSSRCTSDRSSSPWPRSGRVLSPGGHGWRSSAWPPSASGTRSASGEASRPCWRACRSSARCASLPRRCSCRTWPSPWPPASGSTASGPGRGGGGCWPARPPAPRRPASSWPPF